MGLELYWMECQQFILVPAVVIFRGDPGRWKYTQFLTVCKQVCSIKKDEKTEK